MNGILRPSCWYWFGFLYFKICYCSNVYDLDINECSDGTHECSDDCYNTEGSYTCTCDGTGYEVDDDGVTCVGELLYMVCEGFNECLFIILDINECDKSNGGCDHKCNNTDGSFNCYCNNGFVLDSDNIGCSGMYVSYSI